MPESRSITRDVIVAAMEALPDDVTLEEAIVVVSLLEKFDLNRPKVEDQPGVTVEEARELATGWRGAKRRS
jgi:hypothetical protein